MQAEIVCSVCGHRWQPAVGETHCPHCHGVSADPIEAATPPGAIAEGEPPFALLVEDDDPRLRRGVRRRPQGWVALSVTLALVSLSAGVDLWLASAEVDKGQAIREFLAGRNGMPRYTHAQTLVNRLMIVELVLLLATTAMAFRWIYTAYSNLRLLRVKGLKDPPTWRFVAWFLPPGIFFLPPSSIHEIWRASNPKAPVDSDAWKATAGSWLIWLWWVLFLFRHVRININIVPFPIHDATSLNLLLAATWISAASCFVGVAAAALFCVILLRIENRQWQRFERVQDL